ncbi:unnamed protein product [Paramecium sonneborni]|uniref:Uncharacterized protein n=1 Tax=Paramecium sonneborni TaxID=65129 RepID=A0A8S1NKD2_9CILI|nr:unnamed protein product [Paramecium sonneborni]
MNQKIEKQINSIWMKKGLKITKRFQGGLTNENRSIGIAAARPEDYNNSFSFYLQNIMKEYHKIEGLNKIRTQLEYYLLVNMLVLKLIQDLKEFLGEQEQLEMLFDIIYHHL